MQDTRTDQFGPQTPKLAGRQYLGPMARGLGSDRNPDRLVLTQKGLNGRKGTFFGHEMPRRENKRSNEATRAHHRTVGLTL